MRIYEEPNAILYQGHALDVLKEMAANSVDCVITSPPYWGLRSYKTEPIIWGNNHCEHEWGQEIVRRDRGKSEDSQFVGQPRAMIGTETKQGNFCLKCGAWKGELGLEPTIELYIDHLIQIFDEVKRVLKKTGTCWVNIGDGYCSGNQPGRGDKQKYGGKEGLHCLRGGTKEVPAKSLCLIPERFALGMVERGWILRNVIIWYKGNPMPESVKDRFTGSYEYVYFFTKSRKYWFEQQFEKYQESTLLRAEYGSYSQKTDAGIHGGMTLKSQLAAFDRTLDGSYPGRNKRDVWEINTHGYPDAHFAVFPEKLVETPILSGCPWDGVVLDPFAGTGTTGAVAKRLGRKYIGIELSEKYCKLHIKRLQAVPLAMELL